MSKTYFTVMRKWVEPNIRTVVTDEQISVGMEAGDFANILADEIFWKPCLTKRQLSKRILAVADNVRHTMQKETAKVSS